MGILPKIADESIDMILCDLPYGTTQCKWDVVIPFEPLWVHYKRVIKPNGAIVLFGSEPFSSHLRLSNLKEYRYDIIWKKDNLKNFFFVKKQIGKIHENISIFYKKQPTYVPQMQTGFHAQSTGGVGVVQTHNLNKKRRSDRHGKTDRYPTSIQEFTSLKKALHPTQKPVPLLEFLIKTYTLEGETVLDNCMGSGSTGVAAKNLNRNFIGIEKEKKYFDMAVKRIRGY